MNFSVKLKIIYMRIKIMTKGNNIMLGNRVVNYLAQYPAVRDPEQLACELCLTWDEVQQEYGLMNINYELKYSEN